MLAKLNKINNWQAALIIAVLGFAVFFTGLTNPFQGDDLSQIVNNVPVHSISHIQLFFEGGTFYEGKGLAPLGGTYFKPLLTTVYSLLYTIFGAHTFYFHLLQLLLCIGSSILLYLFFRFSFKPALALFLSLVFLLHPIDSQVVYSIPNLQDSLFFFFGILALYLLVRYKSVRILIVVALCLFLSLLAKETAILFVLMALLYLFWFNRDRLYWFAGIIVLPMALYMVLTIHAVGLFANPNNAPIDRLSLVGRLLTAPSLLQFYITKFIFPWKLATAYYWVYPRFSFNHFVVPLVIDLVVVAVIAYGAFFVHQRASKSSLYSYLFFAVWSALGLLMILQISPLDMTATEAWFYFPMVGVLGMIGIIIKTLAPGVRIDRRTLIIFGVIIIALLGVRSAVRGADYKSQLILSAKDIKVSKEDYTADDVLSIYYFNHGNPQEAKGYAINSVAVFPNALNELTLGGVLGELRDYSGSYSALVNGLQYKESQPIYDDLAVIALHYGNPSTNKLYLMNGLHYFPHDSSLWLHLAILDEMVNDNNDARTAIANAANYGHISQSLYDNIITNKSFELQLENGQYIHVP